MKSQLTIVFILFCLISCQNRMNTEDSEGQKSWDIHGKLEVSENGHFIQHEDGTPFLWLGGTLWGMTEWCTRADIDKYLDNRKQKGFNVIQVCLLWGKRHEDPIRFPVNAKNVYGRRALLYTDSVPDPAKPDLKDGGTSLNPNDYWDHVDYGISAAAERDMYIALLPVWGRRYVNASHPGHSVKMFNEENARSYGSFLGERYKAAPNLIWVLGGDVNALSGGDHRYMYRIMAEGIIFGITGKDVKWNKGDPAWDEAFMTYHPDGNPFNNSSDWFHEDPWLDFNMIETHIHRNSLYESVLLDYNLETPVKPVVMGEGHYEGYTNKNLADGAAVRRQAYQTFFAGGAGHTYGGHHDGKGNGPLFSPYAGWETMLEMEGVQCFPHLKKFLIHHEWWKWAPNTTLRIQRNGSGEFRKVAVRHPEKNKVLIYFPDYNSVDINMNFLPEDGDLMLTWFNPIDGSETSQVIQMDNMKISLKPPENWLEAVLVFEEE
jgi:hypothetical protein